MPYFRFPVSGYVDLQAETKEEAVEKAKDKYDASLSHAYFDEKLKAFFYSSTYGFPEDVTNLYYDHDDE